MGFRQSQHLITQHLINNEFVYYKNAGLLVDYCDDLISSLDSHSDSTHSLQSKFFNAKFLQICSNKETNTSTSYMARGWENFHKICIFGENLFL